LQDRYRKRHNLFWGQAIVKGRKHEPDHSKVGSSCRRVAGYISGLAYEGGAVRFLLRRGYHIPSPVGLGHNHDRLVADLDAFLAGAGLPLARFARGENNEDRARLYQDAVAAGTSGVVFVGKAPEEIAAWTKELSRPVDRRALLITRQPPGGSR
jgi:hypothetical protein